MCGILGANKTVCPDRRTAERALLAVRWRGRDALSVQDAGSHWLGVARLRISDEGADQPIHCPRTGRFAALNGALTSAAEEWPRYAGRNQTRNDAELLLLALEADGADALLGFTGPYAFAVVDPEKDELWLGRDPEGEKPLWVLLDDSDRVLAFASTRTALLQVAAATGARFAGPDERALVRLLRFGLLLEDDWVFRGSDLRARQLPPGLWHAAGGGPLEAVSPRTSRWRGQDFESALRDATARCADAEVPVGLALSGGIDSSCLAVCLAESEAVQSGARAMPLAYHARRVGADDRETLAARAVAARTGLRTVELQVGTDAFDALPSLVEAHGMPLPDPSVVAVHALARRASLDGIRVLLSGEGADELLLGYPRHRATARLPRFGLPLPAPGLSMRRAARAWRALTTRPAYDALLEVAPPAFRRAVSISSVRSGITDDLAPSAANSLEAARAVDRVAYLRGDLLPKLDVATLAAGIEGRCPFLDPAVTRSREVLAEDGLGLLGKRPLRRAFAAALPAGHFDQPKRGFASPVDLALRGDGILVDLLRDERTLARGHLRRDGVRRMLDLHRSGRFDLGHPLFVLASLELWFRVIENLSVRAEAHA